MQTKITIDYSEIQETPLQANFVTTVSS